MPSSELVKEIAAARKKCLKVHELMKKEEDAHNRKMLALFEKLKECEHKVAKLLK